jgi:enoyl-CoA hydratase
MIELEISEGIATVTLSRSPVNAMNDAWIERFQTILDTLSESHEWSVLLLRSDLKIFSAGADLEQIRDRSEAPPPVQAEVGRRYQRLFSRIEALPQVTIVALHGAAMGGGLELALACDLRVATSSTRLSLPEVMLGLIPGAGGTQRLTALCGRAVASRMILGAEIVSGDEAQRIGLVQWVTDEAQLQSEARSHAVRIAALPAHAVQAAKDCIREGLPPLQDGFDREHENVIELLGTLATKSLVRQFLEGRRNVRSED